MIALCDKYAPKEGGAAPAKKDDAPAKKDDAADKLAAHLERVAVEGPKKSTNAAVDSSAE